jgi:hypothetical protein
MSLNSSFLYDYFYIRDNRIYFDRSYDFDYSNSRILTLQYRGCGYRPKLILSLLRELGFENETKHTVYGRIKYFEAKCGYKFREKASRKSRDQKLEYYKRYIDSHIGKAYPLNFEYTENRPLQGGDYRSFFGITKDEESLLKEIRG